MPPIKKEVEDLGSDAWWIEKFTKGLPTIVTSSKSGIPELHPEFKQALTTLISSAVEAEQKRIQDVITPPELNGMVTTGNCIHGSISGLCGKCAQDTLLKIEQALTQKNHD